MDREMINAGLGTTLTNQDLQMLEVAIGEMIDKELSNQNSKVYGTVSPVDLHRLAKMEIAESRIQKIRLERMNDIDKPMSVEVIY